MTRLLVLSILALLTLAPQATGAPVEAEERWYVVEMQDQRSGWMREFTRPAGDEGELIESGMEMLITLGRGGMQATIRLETLFLETDAGEPIEMSMTQRLGEIPATTHYVFTEDGVELTATNAGQTFTQTLPRPGGEWMAPAATARYIERQLEAGETEITTATLTPIAGLTPVESTMRILDRETIEVMGKEVPALRTAITNSMAPGTESVAYVDHAGRQLRLEQAFAGTTMVILAADEALATSKLDPVEIMASTFVKPGGAQIADPRGATRAVYRLRSHGALPPAFTGGAQQAEAGDGSVRVVVDLATVDDAPAGPEHLESSSMIAADDPVVEALTREALESVGATPLDRALALRDFAHRHINEKSLGVGFASASEVARARAGDCTEHAVLLAAMLRSAGVPSRVVNGLVYTQAFAGARDVFGYHAWTQAHVDGRWIDLDATLHAGRDAPPFDAAHIALVSSAMSDGEFVNALVEIAPLIGALEIEVVEIE